MIKQEINFSRHSGVYTLETEQVLPISLENAWDFFSNPDNLGKITPPEMGFKITSGKHDKMFAGQLITYNINIFPGLQSNWVTEITNVKHHTYFIDEQRFGPYKMWHHEHHIKKIEQGIQMKDKVIYKIPFGFLGHIVHSIFIRKKLHTIFKYRSEILNTLFKNEN